MTEIPVQSLLADIIASAERIVDHRNLVAHGYDAVIASQLVETIEQQLPPLIDEARTILSSFGPPPNG